MFRKYRVVRRKGRHIDELADRMSDRELREAFRSMGGKFVISHVIEKSLRQNALDGLEVWIEQHFETTDDGLARA